MKRLGLQLYTVREQLEDASLRVETLKRLKKLGCDTVQLFGTPELVTQWAPDCRAQGMEVIGFLGSLEECEAAKDELFAVCKECGIRDIGVSSTTCTYEEAVDYIPRLNRFAACVTAAGFTFSYHNHSNEFTRTSCGKTVMDLFIEGFDSCVNFMPDTYWIQHGGADVRHFLERIGQRVKILHLKDMKRGENGPDFAEVGYGNLWFEGILETAFSLGIEEYVIEQDRCDGDPVESVEKSLNYLKNLNLF